MNDNRYCVIMAGGSGNKFWPVSRESRPIQFLDIAGTGKSFVRMTFDRFARIIPKENILVVTLARFRDLALEQLPDLLPGNLLLEPYSRNTAPCIAYAAYSLLKRDPGALMIASPADHIILDESEFEKTLISVLDYAGREPVLMTLGIRPTKPATTYGYIQVTGSCSQKDSNKPQKVKTFTEKPDESLAKVFCSSGEFFWNSGIFVWKAAVIRSEMERYIPDVTMLFNGWEDALESPQEDEFLERIYADCPKISIDYAVMEKTDKAWLYPGQFGWSDIDNWDALFKTVHGRDFGGNLVSTPEKLICDEKDNLVITTRKKKLYAVKGLKDYLVIDTEDALLICPRDDRKFKDFIASLGMPEYEEFR